jgi:hypothetical protein
MGRNVNKLSGREMHYLNKFLFRFGKVKVRKYRNIPEVILNSYVAELSASGKSFPGVNTNDQRLQFINEYIDFVMNVEARYKRLLKLHGLKGYQIGSLLGYKNQICWHNSYKRYTYIRFLVTMIDKHEELLERLNGGK